MANSNNWGEIYKSTWWGDKAWSANTLFIDSAPPGFGLNLLKASEDMDNTLDWTTRTGASVSAQNTNDPNGKLTAERVDFAADKNSRIQQLVTLEASTTYTFSVHAKVPSGSQDFRLKALGVTGVGSFTALSSDWTRFDFDFTTTTAGTYTLAIMNATDGAARSIQLWGAMLNEGADVGGYVKTEASVGGSSPTPEYSGFGDEFVGVTAYYSLRQFTEAETLNAIRVRRSSDDTEQDIGFDANGDLDTTALTTFVNSGEAFTNADITSATGWTLGSNTTYNASTEAFDLVSENGLTVRQGKNVNGHTFAITIVLDSITSGGVKIYAGGTQSAVISTAGTHTLNIVGGASNTILGINPNGTVTCSISSFSAIDTTADGAVTTWYDQSGNGNDATNATESEQPLVVSGGTLVEENSKAAINFDGVDDYLQNTTLVSNQPTTHHLVAKANQSGVLQRFFDGGVSSSTRHSIFQNANQFQYFAGGTFTGSSDDTNQNLHYFLANGTSSEIAINGATASIGSAGTNTLNGLTFAARWDGGANFGDVLIQELIIFESDQSSNRTGIETNINDHFTIYP